MINKNQPINYEGKFISLRDKSIVEFYQDKLK